MVDFSGNMIRVAANKVQEMIEDADEEYREKMPSIKLGEADCTNLDYPDDSFDTVVQSFGKTLIHFLYTTTIGSLAPRDMHAWIR